MTTSRKQSAEHTWPRYVGSVEAPVENTSSGGDGHEVGHLGGGREFLKSALHGLVRAAEHLQCSEMSRPTQSSRYRGGWRRRRSPRETRDGVGTSHLPGVVREMVLVHGPPPRQAQVLLQRGHGLLQLDGLGEPVLVSRERAALSEEPLHPVGVIRGSAGASFEDSPALRHVAAGEVSLGEDVGDVLVGRHIRRPDVREEVRRSRGLLQGFCQDREVLGTSNVGLFVVHDPEQGDGIIHEERRVGLPQTHLVEVAGDGSDLPQRRVRGDGLRRGGAVADHLLLLGEPEDRCAVHADPNARTRLPRLFAGGEVSVRKRCEVEAPSVGGVVEHEPFLLRLDGVREDVLQDFQVARHGVARDLPGRGRGVAQVRPRTHGQPQEASQQVGVLLVELWARRRVALEYSVSLEFAWSLVVVVYDLHQGPVVGRSERSGEVLLGSPAPSVLLGVVSRHLVDERLLVERVHVLGGAGDAAAVEIGRVSDGLKVELDAASLEVRHQGRPGLVGRGAQEVVDHCAEDGDEASGVVELVEERRILRRLEQATVEKRLAEQIVSPTTRLFGAVKPFAETEAVGVPEVESLDVEVLRQCHVDLLEAVCLEIRAGAVGGL